MFRRPLIGFLALAAGFAGVAAWIGHSVPPALKVAAVAGAPPAFVAPDDARIPAGAYGDVIRLGEKVFTQTRLFAPQFVGNDLQCSNCHLQAGRLAGSAPLWAAYPAYPAYRAKNGHVNSFEERLQECFRYSMNGKMPPPGDPVLVALQTYSYFLAKGLPIGEDAPGKGFPQLPKPAVTADYGRGAAVFAGKCAACHGAQGQGQVIGGKLVFPPIWGARSYNWGAGMASIQNAAAFIRANMPLGMGGSLTVQQAWDVATFVDSQVRPQDPRFDGDVARTRRNFQNSPFSAYGTIVNGVLLGDPATTPPAGTVPIAKAAK
jgi:thiosulfate dehydrogenase